MRRSTSSLLFLVILALMVACGGQGETPTATKAPPAEQPTATESVAIPTQPAAPKQADMPAATASPEPKAPASPTPENTPTEAPPSEAVQDSLPWWNNTVFYEIFVRSFQDSDGDGVGDINGLIGRLDYLNDGDPQTTDDLGVTGIWLMPIMESPSYHGYDVVDYYQIDQEYGTKEDFQRLLDEAHARGIKVIVDLVMNHTSREHPWFQESMDPDSDRRDWYVWADENPGFRGPEGQRVWHAADGGYYYAIFWDGMPDLNYKNPEVTQAMFEIVRYWLQEMGVDGFRLDAIKFMVEDGSLQQNTLATHAWLEGFHDFYKSINPQAFTVGEAWTGTQQVVDYTGDEVDVAFQFDLARDMVSASREGIGSLVKDAQEEVVDSFPPGQYAIFLTNHDQNRVMSDMRGDEAAARVAASMLLTSPGVPFIYYGEEIGMLGEKPDEDIRRPMQWTAEGPGAGFTEGQPWRPPYEDYPDRNVAAQEEDPDSLLNHYRRLIHLRSEHSALRDGAWTLVDTDPGRLYATLRYDDEEALLVLINPSRREVTDYSLGLPAGPLSAGVSASLVFGEGDASSPEVNNDGGFDQYVPVATLPPQSTLIIDLSSP
ncbi:MAG: alpha-amylase family glycosyl hydrolase [Chloroflexota bacterium]|jgi:glycosidase